MSWQTLSLHFKQQYDGAFRYLDRCGEFIIAAIDEMDFLPGDTKPTGAKLEIPEQGLTAAVDTVELSAGQEMPKDSGEFFLKTCIGLTELVQKNFQPKAVIKNGFAIKYFWPIANADTLLETSLRFGGNAHVELGKHLGLLPDHKKLDFEFKSGSMELHVLLHPVTFEKVTINRHTPTLKASSLQKGRVRRLNQFAERFDTPLSHALLLEIDLRETEPPLRSLEHHFIELRRYADILRTEFAVK